MEVTVAHMARYRCEQFVFLDDLLQAWHEINEVFWRHYKVVYIRRRVLIFDLASKQLETIPTHNPELLALSFGRIFFETH